jgi:hypothetical protein
MTDAQQKRKRTRNPYTKEENDQIIAYVNRHAKDHEYYSPRQALWEGLMSEFMPHRTVKSLKWHWQFIRPSTPPLASGEELHEEEKEEEPKPLPKKKRRNIITVDDAPASPQRQQQQHKSLEARIMEMMEKQEENCRYLVQQQKEMLERFKQDLQQAAPEQASSEKDDDDAYEVEEIVDKQVRKWRGKRRLLYRVRWKGCDEDQDTWLPIEKLQTCRDIWEKYEISRMPKKSK